MQLTFEPARLTGLAILAVAGATALSLGACSSSPKSPEASPASPGKSSAGAEDSVSGLIASVSGNAVQVTEKTGTATVDVSPKTPVVEVTDVALTDIAAGNCVIVNANPGSAPGGAVTANSVQLNPQGGGGKCPQPRNAEPGKVIGTVTSVADNVINVTIVDANGNPASTEVTVTDKTHYARHAYATLAAITQGKCVIARGAKDGGGTLQATAVTVVPARAGKC